MSVEAIKIVSEEFRRSQPLVEKYAVEPGASRKILVMFENLQNIITSRIELELVEQPDPWARKRTGSLYAIGTEHHPHEWGMWHGPNPSLEKMTAVRGKTDRCAIIEFRYKNSIEPVDNRVLYRWSAKEEQWLRVEEEQERTEGENTSQGR